MADQFADCLAHCGESDVAFACRHCNYFGICWAVSCSIDLSTVLYLLDYCDLVSFLLEVALPFALVWIVDFDFEQLALLGVCIVGGDKREEAGMVVVGFWLW